MAPPKGFAKPRGSGRKKGSLNKSTLERQKVVARAVGEARTRGQLAVEALEEGMAYYGGLAAQYQPRGPTPDIALFNEYMAKKIDIAKALAPYQSPKLAQTTLRSDEAEPVMTVVKVKFV